MPNGVTQITIQARGAAGGNDVSNNGGRSGAGGYAQGTLDVTAGENLTVIVGQGGVPGGAVRTYRGGGASGS